MWNSNRKQKSHTLVAECELYEEERDVLEREMRDLNKSGMKSFDALDSREKQLLY